MNLKDMELIITEAIEVIKWYVDSSHLRVDHRLDSNFKIDAQWDSDFRVDAKAKEFLNKISSSEE